jgi:hypothetical protein
MPPTAAFCGDCGTALTTPTSPGQEPTKKERSSSQEPPLPSFSLKVNETPPTNGHAGKAEETEARRFQQFEPRSGLLIVLLVLVAGFFYWLGNSPQTQQEAKIPVTASESQPLAPAPPTFQKNEASEEQKPPLSGEEKKSTGAATNPEEKKSSEEPPPNPPPPLITEQPLVPPRFYRIMTPTSVRDKPEATGKAVAQLQPDTLIHVVAIVSGWLKVESKSTPPKPPGYVWLEDTQPEPESNTSEQAANKPAPQE